MDTPVAVIVFNRPKATERLLRRLAQVRPRQVFVIRDGARLGIAGEEARVAAVSDLFTRLPWSCQVIRDYSGINLGCRLRVTSGLNWLFSHVPQAMILEDDCLPAESFFPYCEELLQRYADDERVGSICGMTHDMSLNGATTSYRFSRYCFVWGWATWRRAWVKNDPDMTPFDDETVNGILKSVFPSWRARLYWSLILKRCKRGQIDTWDYPWLLSCWKNHMMHVVPRVSLVENIGIGPESTHTQSVPYRIGNILSLQFPLRHPDEREPDFRLDDSVEDRIFSRSVFNRLVWLANRFGLPTRS
jgi:hypothetical protein